MKKLTKLICSQSRSVMSNLNLSSAKLLGLLGISSSSLFFNPVYSQGTGEYYTGNPNDPKSEIKKIDKKTWDELNSTPNNYTYWVKDAQDRNEVTKWYIVPKNKPQVTPSQTKTLKVMLNLNKDFLKVVYDNNFL